jgi:hypothetical protein
MPNERKLVICRDFLSKPEVVWYSRNDINQNKCTCPTCHLVPTEEIEVSKPTKVTTAIPSIPGGSSGSNLEIHVQDHKMIREKK